MKTSTSLPLKNQDKRHFCSKGEVFCSCNRIKRGESDLKMVEGGRRNDAHHSL